MELDGDFAEALELLDEAIDEFPDRLQETFDEIDLIGKELAYAADDRRRMECCERLSDEYIENIRKSLPELPDKKFNRYINEYKSSINYYRKLVEFLFLLKQNFNLQLKIYVL